MTLIKAALLDRDNQVIGEVFDAPQKGHTVEIAGCFTADGDAVNVKTYKISRSKRNMEKARYEQPVSKVGSYYTFHCVENDTVVLANRSLDLHWY